MENQQEKQTYSHYRQSKNKFGEPIYIPVIDVRDGITERMMAEAFLKASNTSRYITYNRYHISPKK